MKICIVYDSAFGNTKQVAEAMAQALEKDAEVTLKQVSEMEKSNLDGLNLLIVGSPTQKFTMLPAMKAFLKKIPSGKLKGVKVAAFDTRIPEAEINKIKILKFFVALFGYAAEKIGKTLIGKGGAPISKPEGFYVGGTEGPLLEKELERAKAWAQSLIKK
jgi:flavodoxin